MFDDLDVCAPEPHPPSVLFQSSGSGTNYSESSVSPVPQENHEAEELLEGQIVSHSQGLNEHVQIPIGSSPLPKLDIDSGIPFKAHGPIKTSSPIEYNTSEKIAEKPNEEEEDHGVTPILFNSEDEAEEPQAEPVPDPKPLCNGQVTKESDDCELESPPSRVTLTKVSSHKPVMEMPSRDENIKKSDQEARMEPEVASDTKECKLVSTQPPEDPSSRVGKDMTSFLKKLQLARSKPSCSQKSPIKVQPPPPPPEPEDDFLILEDESPLWFSIPSKTASNKRQRLSKSSSTEKENSTEKGIKDGPVEVPQKQKEAKTATSELNGRAVNQRKKKKKDKEKNPEVVESDDNRGDLLSHQDPPAGSLAEQEKPHKQKLRKKVSAEPSEKPEDEPKHKTNVEPETEEPAQKTVTNEHKSTKRKNSKAGKISLKGKRKPPEVSEAVETEHDDVFREQSQEIVQEPAGTADLRDITAKDILSTAEREAKKDKKSATATSSSSEDAQLVGRRKKKQPGDWWVSCPQSPEKTENPQPLKKPKQNSKEPGTTVPSTLKNKKGKVYTRRNAKETTKSSSDHTSEAKESIRKQTKRRIAGDKKIKETATKTLTAKAELEEQKIPDQDLDEESSPLVFSKRDHSLNLGGEPFQKVYQHTSHPKKSSASTAPVSQMCQPKTQLRETEPTKRRRKPPGDWWAVPTEVDNEEIIATESQQPLIPKEPKKQKERGKRPKQTPSRLGTPKNGNVASKTPGGAPVTLVKPLSAPKTVKRSLATFKDIFTSVEETPAAASNRDVHQPKRRNVTSQPVEEAADTGPTTGCRPDACALVGPNVDECTLSNQEIPQERQCQTEDTSRVLRSGPSSMIELEKYDDDDMNLPSSRVLTALSVSDFCAPPLKPLTLHSKDRENLTEWFQSLWFTETDGGAKITPDQFQWYFYQDCALGIQVDIDSSSVCCGKLLMGSYMKKPLWVDHSATTTFSLLTSSVSVTVDGRVSRYSSGQAFMVECGRAYSIQNNNAQPAVLYFNRMLAESSD